jgi:hypothetical protein
MRNYLLCELFWDRFKIGIIKVMGFILTICLYIFIILFFFGRANNKVD